MTANQIVQSVDVLFKSAWRRHRAALALIVVAVFRARSLSVTRIGRELPTETVPKHAIKRVDRWLANRIYSGVPAEEIGCEQRITIGPMSGQSNIIHWFKARGMDPKPQLVERLMQQAKNSTNVLSEQEIWKIIQQGG